MSSILYYSNYCQNSKNLLATISKSSVKNNLHYLCIDKRTQKNGKTYIVLENNQEIELPKNVNRVPALLLLNQNYRVLFGEEILEHLKPVEEVNKQVATDFNGEPSAFAINSGFSGVVSDNYSYLDQGIDELSAQGDGGMRQQRHYCSINQQDKINTPEDDFVPDKVDESSLKEYEDKRRNI